MMIDEMVTNPSKMTPFVVCNNRRWHETLQGTSKLLDNDPCRVHSIHNSQSDHRLEEV